MVDAAENPADLALYREIKSDLLGRAMAGKFVLIKDGELVDVYNTYKEASILMGLPQGRVRVLFGGDKSET